MDMFQYKGPVRIVERSDLENMVAKVDRIEASMEPGSVEIALKGLATAVVVAGGIYFLSKPSSEGRAVRAAKEAASIREKENLEAKLAELKRETGKA